MTVEQRVMIAAGQCSDDHPTVHWTEDVTECPVCAEHTARYRAERERDAARAQLTVCRAALRAAYYERYVWMRDSDPEGASERAVNAALRAAPEVEAMRRLHCSQCGKSVSTEFIPVATDTPDEGLIVRAWIECPECIEKRPDTEAKLATLAAGAPPDGEWEASTVITDLAQQLLAAHAAIREVVGELRETRNLLAAKPESPCTTTTTADSTSKTTTGTR